jgi:hypothetical protein
LRNAFGSDLRLLGIDTLYNLQAIKFFRATPQP